MHTNKPRSILKPCMRQNVLKHYTTGNTDFYGALQSIPTSPTSYDY